jgi:regulator of RNase E activity RraA
MHIVISGAKGYVRLAAIGSPISLNAGTPWPVQVSEGDIILADIHGVVCIPARRVAQVAQICAERSKEDALVKADVLERGVQLRDAIRSHRKGA